MSAPQARIGWTLHIDAASSGDVAAWVMDAVVALQAELRRTAEPGESASLVLRDSNGEVVLDLSEEVAQT